MARFYGRIGYVTTTEDPLYPGVFEESIIEKKHFGDVLKDGSKWQQTTYLNDDLIITNRISIVADSFSKQNLGAMKYVEIDGTRWTIRSVAREYPRIILTLGGVYNGPEPT